MQPVAIGKRIVGDGHPCYVIAEAGSNHNRDLDTARRLIDEAASAGADAVKFQTYSGGTLYSRHTPRFDYLSDLTDRPPHELLEAISLPREWQSILAEHCAAQDVEFLSSPFDLQAVAELDDLGVPAFKIASFEIVDLPFLQEVGKRSKPMILSTGMATLGEIEEAMEAASEGGTREFVLLQCASVYPSPPHIMNLRAIATMKAAFGVPVGLSDHTTGIHVSTAAVASGANILEKHYTLDRSHPGPDHPFAIEPEDLKSLVRQVRDVEAAMGDGLKRGPSPEESAEMFSKARRSVVAATPIPAGTRITRDMLTVKRPGYGIKPKFISTLIGRSAAVDIEEDEVISWEMV